MLLSRHNLIGDPAGGECLSLALSDPRCMRRKTEVIGVDLLLADKFRDPLDVDEETGGVDASHLIPLLLHVPHDWHHD